LKQMSSLNISHVKGGTSELAAASLRPDWT
jgi:hypothetical protein